MGASWLGCKKCKACNGGVHLELVGVSTGEGIDMAEEPEFTEGVCGDGAAILMDGVQLSISDVLERLRKGAEAERIVTEMWDMLYGQNLQVGNWHKNGDLEPMDNFFELNHWVVE
jgi:hypothetical protein